MKLLSLLKRGKFIVCAHAACLLLSAPVVLSAAPLVAPGDSALRHDIQLLADQGLITTPVTSWPLSWGAILNDLEAATTVPTLGPAVQNAFLRTMNRAGRETRTDYLHLGASAAVSSNPQTIRGFNDSPREEAELAGNASWIGDRFSLNLSGAVVSSPSDDRSSRADGSMIGFAFGNYSLSLSTMDRWWGPGWDGSLILSNNARPIPSLVFDRTMPRPFESKWLSWLGPWDLSILWGRMEADRHIPNARFFGMRMNFKPHPTVEIGISRTAQWCGEGRPCGFDTFVDMFIGNDNIGDAGITGDNEAGNQMAGFDVRWAPRWRGWPVAFYGQMIGEDEAGGLPSRHLAQFGGEITGTWQTAGSWRVFGELAGTSCDFVKDDLFNCAYNQAIYRTGYRYRGRPVGHGLDNDAKVWSTGLVLIDENDRSTSAVLRFGELNRDGSSGNNVVAATAADLASLDLSHKRMIGTVLVDFGLGYEKRKDVLTGMSDSLNRAYVRVQRNF